MDLIKKKLSFSLTPFFCRKDEKSIFYPDEQGRLIFLRLFNPEKKESIIFLLNPFFDEIERIQSFQYAIAKYLRDKNNLIVHFDYFGTGDSGGESSEFKLELCISHTIELIKIFHKKNPNTKIFLIGIRIGADLALIASKYAQIDGLILIDPILKGSRYWHEIELRKKAYLKLNKIENNGKIYYKNCFYEDFEGFLISPETIESLKNMDNLNLCLENLNILLLRQANNTYHSLHEQFINQTKYLNNLTVFDFQNSILENQFDFNTPNNHLFITVIDNFLQNVKKTI